MNIGEVEFEFDNNGVRESLGLVQDIYTWQSFHALQETEKSLLLMIDSDTALIVPKRAASSDDALEDLKSLIESHIGVRA